MKVKVIFLSTIAALSMSGLAIAADMPSQEAAVPAVEQAAPVVENATPVAVGNKFCPVTGMEIPADQLGKNTVEYNGKVFNLCTPECKEKFMADAENMSKIAMESLAAQEAAPIPVTEKVVEPVEKAAPAPEAAK